MYKRQVGDDRISATGLPVFRFPEDAVAALAPQHAVRRWRRDVAAFGDDIELTASQRVALDACRPSAPGERRRLRLGDEALDSLLDALGVAFPATVLVGDDGEAAGAIAASAADGIDGPVALKAGGLSRLHPGRAGGVALDPGADVRGHRP